VSVEVERSRERGCDPLGEHSDDLITGQVLAEDHELVAAEARHRVAAAYRRTEPTCHLLEHVVTAA
jgi:hypothetical protein